MKKVRYMGLLHEINSPIASLQAVLFTQKDTIPPLIHAKLSGHLTRLIQASTVLSEAISTDLASPDQLIRLIKIWLDLHQTPFQQFTTSSNQTSTILTHPITGQSSKTDYTQLIWTICKRQTKDLGGTIAKTKSTLTLSLPEHLLP